MFNPRNGELVECTDEAILEYLEYLNHQRSHDQSFIICSIPPTHLFVREGHAEELKKAINELVSSNTFAEEDRANGKNKRRK